MQRLFIDLQSLFGSYGSHQNAGSTALITGKPDKMIRLTLASFKQPLKWFAFAMGLGSTICVVQGWQLAAMVLSLPFCLIWICCAWLRTEPQLKYINMTFTALQVYGIARYVLINACPDRRLWRLGSERSPNVV